MLHARALLTPLLLVVSLGIVGCEPEPADDPAEGAPAPPLPGLDNAATTSPVVRPDEPLGADTMVDTVVLPPPSDDGGP